MCTLKIVLKYYIKRALQNKVFKLSCGRIKRRKCVRMIQPVNALTPRATYRGTGDTYGKKTRVVSDSGVALINAGGVAAAAGGITAAVSRAYTSSWAQAMVLGLLGSALTLFFMTPHLIEKFHQNRAGKGATGDLIAKSEAQKLSNVVKECSIPVKKMVPFKADKA